MSDQDISLIAHLMRRAGFGAPLEELQARAEKGYDATVEELLDPESQPPMERDLMICLLYTSPSPRDATLSRMPSSA